MNDQKYRLIPSRWERYKSTVAASTSEVVGVITGKIQPETEAQSVKAHVLAAGSLATTTLTGLAAANALSNNSGVLASTVFAALAAAATKVVSNSLDAGDREEREEAWRQEFEDAQRSIQNAKAAALREQAQSVLESASSTRFAAALEELQSDAPDNASRFSPN